MKKFIQLFVAMLAVMLTSQFIYAQSLSPGSGTMDINKTVDVPDRDVDALLYSQLPTGGGVASQEFGDFPLYDCNGADDFIIPGGQFWNITDFIFYGYEAAAGGFASVNVFIFPDMGGFPGETPSYTFMGLSCVNTAGFFDVSLGGTGVTLSGGTYWISVQAIGDFGTLGQWFWNGTTPISNSPAHWRNPGDGFATGATVFTDVAIALGFSTDLAFDIIGTNILDLPEQAFGPSPFDGEIDIVTGTIPLTWFNGNYTNETQVLFGTEYPPVNIVQDWTTPLTTFNVTVDWNLQYFWQVNSRNANGTTTGDVWGFTTLIQPPGSFTATAGDYDIGGVANDVLLEWVSSVVPSRALLGYDIYENAVQIAALVPGDDYTVLNATYNMAGTGNTYYAVAVFDEGISAPSNTDDALVNGFGTFDGYVDDFDSGLALENVTIDIVGVDPQSNPWVYQLFTDALGDYQETDVIAGTYDFTASLAQYYPETALGVVLPFAGTVTQDFTLTPWGPPACPTVIYPVDEEQEIDPVGVVLAWDLDDITVEYKILFSTEFPPQAGDILVDWTAAAESYAIPYDLDLNMQYFWKVHVRNMWGEVTTCDTWGFTTIINPPGAFTATAGDYDGGGVDNDVLMEWVTSVVPSRDLIGYNIFQNGTQIATEVPGDSYTLYDAPYNMTAPGNEYWAVAVFDEGVSEESDHDFAYVNGFGSVDGYAYEGPATATTLAGVAVHIEGVDPQLGAWSYDAVTDGSGYYSIPEVIAGDYDFTGTLWQYNDAEVFGVTVNFGANTAQDLYLDPWGVPNCVTTPIPFDTEQEVYPVALTLGWDLSGALMNEFRILLDTEYPPMTELVDWTPFSNHYDIPFDLDPNLQYFWQVEVRNMWGTTTACDIWGFTTIINPPGHFTATAFDGDGGGVDNDVRLEWESSVVPSRALIGYNIFQNGVEIAHLVPDGGYIEYNAPYNMTAPGNEYWAIAVFDEGVSEESNHDFAYVNGFGEFYGYAYDDDSSDLLAGVTVDIVGEDPQGDPWVYQLTTDLSGYYSSDIIIAGLYDFTGSLWQYNDVTYTGVTVGFAGSVQQDLYLVPWGPPSCATDPIPADTEQEVNANNTVLYWTLDAITVEYRLMFDTEYPPTVVMQDWTAAAEEYALPALEPSLQYFWQIQVRNMWGEVTDCDIWGFTTTITVPEDLTATVYDVNNVLLEWTSSEQQDRDFNHYVVYRDGLEIATTPETTYDDLDLAYNPTTCYTYNVEAIFDEGDSDWSDDAYACITGFGMVDGYVYDNLTSDPIVGATVYLEGFGELGDEYDYTFTTDSYGYYEGDVMVGNYDYEVSAVGYLPAFTNDDVAYDATTTNDFYLDEEPYALDYVIATELNDDEVHLEWGFIMRAFNPTYFPFDTKGMTEAQIEKHMIDFLATMGIKNASEFTMSPEAAEGNRDIDSYDIYRGLWDDDFVDMVYLGSTGGQEQFIDYDWGAQPSGVYKWAVVVVYTNNDSDPTYSNYLDKDMETLVHFEITLNSAENPAGTLIEIVNTTGPYFVTYTAVADADGLATIDPIYKGDYNITVSKTGYGTINDAQPLFVETTLPYLLYEIIAPPSNLYVNPNGFATWTGAFTPYVVFANENFDTGIPADWSQTIYSGTGEWEWNDGYYVYFVPPGDGYFAMADSDGNSSDVYDVGLFTAPINLAGQTPVFIEMDRDYQSVAGIDEFAINVYSGGMAAANLEEQIFWSNSDDPSGGLHTMYEIDPSAYANPAMVYVEFYYSTNGDTYLWGVGIDNFIVHNGGERSARELQSFKVWLDDVLSGEPTEEWWDYEANETLVDGDTYLAEVASVYTTGISNRVEYMFTYHPCDYFAGPTSVSADVVVGTMDVMLTWTAVGSNVSGDPVVGVNVFRDGVLIAMVPVGDDFYVDEQLDAATYTYCITNFYESEAQSCQVCDDVTVTPGGYVNGYVTEFATGDPIEGAVVAMLGATDSYIWYTDEYGYYEGEVVAGEYDYIASATGYASETEEDVFIDFGITVSMDFQLLHFPYPVGEVIATEINDNSVLVNWSGQGGGGFEEWLFYDDGINVDGIGGPAIFSWAIKFDPAQLVTLDGGSVTKISIFNRTTAVNTLQIFEGTNAATLLYEQDLTDLEFEAWNEVELTSAVAIDVTKELWITVYTEDGGNYPAACGVAMGEPNGDLITLDGVLWDHLTDYGLMYTWNLGCFVTDMTGKTVALGDITNTKGYKVHASNPALAVTGVANETVSAIRPNSMTTVEMLNNGSRETYIFEDFESQSNNVDINIPGWLNIATVGNRVWRGKSYGGNLYAQATSYNSGEVNVCYLITPVINLDDMSEPRLKFENAQAYWNHDGLTVFISTDFNGADVEAATWEELSCNIAGEDDPAHAWVQSGIVSLADYAGDAYIAFKYEGNGDGSATTSYRLDNIEIYDGGAGIVGYNVYRGPCYGGAEDMVFQGFTLDQTYTDNTWGAADWGVYKWAVEVVYDFNASEFAYSNCLDKDMETIVTVEVTTNSGDSPEGTDVVFTNVSEITDPPIVFEAELDASGIHSWTDFRKGVYDIYVHLNGFADINVSGVEIFDESYFEFMLEELLAPPTDLYVTPTGFATWRAGGVVPFEPYFEDFNEDLPEDWTIVVGGESADTWFWTTDDAGNTLDGTPFMFVDSDAAGFVDMDELLISPVIENTENADMLFIEFDQYLNNFLDDDIGDVDVWDGDQWVTVLHQTTDVGSWSTPDHQMIDVTEYANADFQVRFHYMANYGWYWAVDNFAVTEGEDKYADRMLEYYKVWHDYVFITDQDTTFYQYGDNGEVLVPGTTYMAEVAAVYSTGISAKMQYEWTYYPCDSFPGPAWLIGENVEDTKDVLLTWTDNAPSEIVIINEPFEDYNAGGHLAEQAEAMGRDYWTTWSGAVGGAEDPMVSDAQAHEGTNSVVIEGTNDAVLLLDNYTEGVFNVDFYVYVPTAKVGYFNLLQLFAGSGSSWGTQTYLNPGGVALVDAGGAGTGNFTYTYDTWHQVSYIIDLDTDFAEMFFNGTSVVSWVWSTGAFGSNSLNEFNAVNLYAHAAEGTPGAYFDDIRITQDISDDKSSREIVSIGTNVYRFGDLIAYVAHPDTTYLDEALEPGYYDYCVATVYTADGGDHTWTSCLDDVCVEDVLVPEDCDAPRNLTATLDEETYDAIYLEWNGQEEVFITQNPGAPVNGYYQSYDMGYGVVYDLSAYPDALANSIEFHHASWGVYGPFDYNIHIINWDTEEYIASLGPFITTGDDIWEMDIDLGDVDLGGAANVGFLMEPLSNSPTDAYPCISSDGAGDPQGSVYGPLDDVGSIGSSGIGNFLMNIYIMTAFGEKVMAPRVLDLPVAMNATPRIGSNNVVNEAIINQTATYAGSSREFVGYNIYRDGDMIEELWQEITYTDTDGLEAGNLYCYEVTAMYSICGESAPSNEACAGFVGISVLDASEANLYPNPARDQITIEAVDMTRLHIVNYVGQVVYDTEFDNTYKQVLNTANYQSGVYVARIYTEKGIITKRFVINR